jgi:glycosyltransferase involved in cell wall biosynthesis
MRITVFTIAYNGYGAYIPRWLKSIQSQSYLAHEIIVVLGQDHGLQEIPSGVKVIYHGQPATMGFLRNLALDVATGDYMFYFSADDILLGDALQGISEVDADLIGLRYYQENEVRVTPEIVGEKLDDWETHYIGACGYVAFKNGLRYEDTNWPNYPLLFQAHMKGYTFGRTEEAGAVYIQRPDAHGQDFGNNEQGREEIMECLLLYGLITSRGRLLR